MTLGEVDALISRHARLQEWIDGLEKRLAKERRFKVQIALRKELEKCRVEAEARQAEIIFLKIERSRTQAS
jgi:hypothetical protein